MSIRLVLPFLLLFPSLAGAEGTVSLQNVTHPFTKLQVNDFVRVNITGATPYGTVTVVQNGQAPHVFGSTDADGNWQITAEETIEFIGSYTQYWYVNGAALTPANPDPTMFAWAPALPNFSVAQKVLVSNNPVPLGSGQFNTCGAVPLSQVKWGKYPVAFRSIDGNYVSETQAAIAGWNNVQYRLPLAYSSYDYDVAVVGGSALPSGVLGTTAVYTQGCSPCYTRINQCNGGCLGASVMFGAVIDIGTANINQYASAMGVSAGELAVAVIAHEIGHALPLDHSNETYHICSEVKSLMYPQAVYLMSCGVTSPSPADAAVMTSLYSSSPPYCSIGGTWCILSGYCQY